MSRPKNQITDVEPLQEWEYTLIMAKLSDHWRLFYKIVWQTGTRVGEALAIVKTDICQNSGQIGVWITSEKRKDKLRVHIPLTLDLYNRLQAFIRYERGNRVFPYTSSGAWDILKKAAIRAGVRTYEEENGRTKTTIHPHLFRHAFGHRGMKADLGGKTALEQVERLQKMMRHTSIHSTLVYTKSTKEEVNDAFRILNK